MNSEYFSHNLRRLRLAKGLTQEQLAATLGVSIQSVSRWECGNTLPDVMLLPEIARLYGVTVDDLYREEAVAYANYAQRLVSVYEAIRRSEDFLAAEQEFLRMPQASLTADDLRSWGVLYHYMVQYCASLAHSKLTHAMEYPGVSEDVWCSAALQRLALMGDMGKGHEAAMQYDNAFSYWRKTLELAPDIHAAAYSIGFCYEELGQFDKAYQVWCDITKELDRRGMTIERKYTADLAENCRKRMG